MRMRAPINEDAEAVLDVLSARDTADTGAPDYTLQDLLHEWQASDFELTTDARVGQRDDRIVGYAAVRRRGATIAVDPRCEGPAARHQLAEWTEARERQQGRDVHRRWLGAADTSLRDVLIERGYAKVRSYWRMVRDLNGSEQAGPPPDGIALRTLEVAVDGPAVHALDDLAFSTVADYIPSTFEQFREEHLAIHDLDPGLSVVAEAGGGLAGFALTRRFTHERTGFVDVLAVHPDHQGRGVGSALLRHAFAGYAAAGLGEAQLGVASDNPRAFALYERIGMRQKFRFDIYERAAI